MSFDKETYAKRRANGQRGQDPVVLDSSTTKESNPNSRAARRRNGAEDRRLASRSLRRFKKMVRLYRVPVWKAIRDTHLELTGGVS